MARSEKNVPSCQTHAIYRTLGNTVFHGVLVIFNPYLVLGKVGHFFPNEPYRNLPPNLTPGAGYADGMSSGISFEA